MSDDADPPRSRSRTIFRPSPLAGIKPDAAPAAAPPAVSGGWGSAGVPPAASSPPYTPSPPQQDYGFAPAAPAPAPLSPAGAWQVPPPRLGDDDIPLPASARSVRSLLVEEASEVLALAASLQSGRARLALPDLHRVATEAIARYERAIMASYSEETRQRAKYVLCATIDDIAQNLPNIGHDGAEWARRSLVVLFFRENIGGDRFWNLVEDILARPQQNLDLIELFHSCLAAGFEGRFRVMPDGKRRLHEVMSRLYGALDHPRGLSMTELSPRWRGLAAPLRRISPYSKVALAAAVAALVLLIVFAMLRLILMYSGEDSWKAVRDLTPQSALRLSRVGAPQPTPLDSAQVSRLRQFLEPEIRQKLVAVEEDASTVRVRTTVGQLFKSGSDQLETDRVELFRRIGRAVEAERGAVTVEGHADSDKVATLAYPDNLALSKARAETVAKLVGSVLSNPGRIAAQGFGDNQPIASNDTSEGKTRNRRVEIVVPRVQ